MDERYELRRYCQDNLGDVISAIGKDPEWEFIIGDEAKRVIYADRLKNSVSYVCYFGEVLCGYVRAIVDDGMALYISELFVKPEFRNRKIGQRLIEILKENHRPHTVYVLSDEDLYYEKKGYKRIGSVFEIEDASTG